MDNDDDDETSCSSTPNHFLLSTYKEDPHVYINQTKTNENVKFISSYKCHLCRKTTDNAILTCAECVNTGQFCSSKHELCSNKRREFLLNILNKTDYEEFQQSSSNKSTHFLYSDRILLLKLFQREKKVLQSKFETKAKSSTEINQMSEAIEIRKTRHNLINRSIESLKDQIERKKILNMKTQQRIDEYRLHIQKMEKKLYIINQVLESSHGEIKKNIDLRTTQEGKLRLIRRQRMDELHKYIFPMERVTRIEEHLATRIRDLYNAQQTSVDESNDENFEIVIDEVDRYRIVNSWLPVNGDYQIAKLLSTANVRESSNDPDSPQSALSYEFYDVLSALSHACQLINAIALYLQIHLPFRLHQLEFNTEPITIDCLRADIAKLNANIITTCVSQGILIEFTNVTYTLENLWKVLTLQEYPSRPKPVMYSQEYIDMMEKEINEISRTYLSDYWFDDVEKATTDFLNSDEWEAIDGDIPDDPSVYDHIGPLPTTNSQQNSSMMSNSFDYFKSKSSVFYNTFVRNFKP